MNSGNLFLVYYIILLNLLKSEYTSGHGRLLEPPGRSSLWRFPEFKEYKPIKNWNDHQLFCGGFDRQYKKNGGRCGPCGDPFDEQIPRENEGGGTYGKGIIVRDYKVGQIMEIGIELTRSHKGYFQFRLCEHNNPERPEVQPCFNKHLLQLADGTGNKYFIQEIKTKSEFHNLAVRLPPKVKCRQCVLQWHYRTGNSWGNCTGESNQPIQALGCGNQEVFRACADITIH